MSVSSDLKRARQRTDLADRGKVEVIKDAAGVVREVRREHLAPPLTTGSLADLPYTNATEKPDAAALRRPDGPVTAADFAAQVTAIAKGLIGSGLAAGDRVAVMSRTRYEWTVLDFAIWAAGGVTVPVYPTSSADQVEWIDRDSGARHDDTETPANTATGSWRPTRSPSSPSSARTSPTRR